jgi:hypothetical protein
MKEKLGILYFAIVALSSVIIILFLAFYFNDRVFSSTLTIAGSVNPTVEADLTKYYPKVLQINYVPQSSNGGKLYEAYNWSNPDTLANSLVAYMQQVSSNRANYTIVETINETSWDAIKYNDGTFQTEAYMNNCLHNPETVGCGVIPGPVNATDYKYFEERYNICDRVNNGSIDEVWFFGGPYATMTWEATLIGPTAFYFNSQPTIITKCNKNVPVMGFNYERGLSEMVHDFGHRMEATMAKAYDVGVGSYNYEISFKTGYDYYFASGRNSALNPKGCGSEHEPPNTAEAYDYSNTSVVKTFCEQMRYWNGTVDITKTQDVSGNTWNNTNIDYNRWRYINLPGNVGNDKFGTLNNWWIYLMYPNKASETCGVNKRFSYCASACFLACSKYDINGYNQSTGVNAPYDCKINTLDYAKFLVYWRLEPKSLIIDFNNDGKVNTLDYAMYRLEHMYYTANGVCR